MHETMMDCTRGDFPREARVLTFRPLAQTMLLLKSSTTLEALWQR